MAGPQMTRKLLSLNEAAWHFAPLALRSAANDERSKPVPKVKVKRFDTIPEDVTSKLETTLNDLGNALITFRNPEEPTVEMRNRLLIGLAKGKFRATGFEINPKISRSPKVIPISIFDNQPKINWPKNTVAGLGHLFEGVRVERLSTKENSNAPKIVKISKSTRLGRPSVAPDIIRATKLAAREYGAFRSLVRKLQFPLVREQLLLIDAQRYNAKIPSDRTIAKLIPKALESNIQKGKK